MAQAPPRLREALPQPHHHPAKHSWERGLPPLQPAQEAAAAGVRRVVAPGSERSRPPVAVTGPGSQPVGYVKVVKPELGHDRRGGAGPTAMPVDPAHAQDLGNATMDALGPRVGPVEEATESDVVGGSGGGLSFEARPPRLTQPLDTRHGQGMDTNQDGVIDRQAPTPNIARFV